MTTNAIDPHVWEVAIQAVTAFKHHSRDEIRSLADELSRMSPNDPFEKYLIAALALQIETRHPGAVTADSLAAESQVAYRAAGPFLNITESQVHQFITALFGQATLPALPIERLGLTAAAVLSALVDEPRADLDATRHGLAQWLAGQAKPVADQQVWHPTAALVTGLSSLDEDVVADAIVDAIEWTNLGYDIPRMSTCLLRAAVAAALTDELSESVASLARRIYPNVVRILPLDELAVEQIIQNAVIPNREPTDPSREQAMVHNATTAAAIITDNPRTSLDDLERATMRYFAPA